MKQKPLQKRKKKERAFISHKVNGVYLNFPNGNGLSTVWGQGTYSDNHYYEFKNEDGTIDFTKSYRTVIPEGSNTCEVMPNCSKKTKKLLDKTFPENENGSVFSVLTFEQWLKMVNILNENK